MSNPPFKLIGISGTHRSGKTTLMTWWLDKHPEAQVVPFSVTKCYQEFFGADTPFTMDLQPYVRVKFQHYCLERWEQEATKCMQQGGTWVIDRTPMDFMVYLLMGLTECVDNEINRRASGFLEAACEVMVKMIHFNVLIPPVLHTVLGEMPPGDDTKLTGKVSLANQMVWHATLMNLVDIPFLNPVSTRLVELPRGIHSVDNRVDWVDWAEKKVRFNMKAQTEG